MSKTEPEPQPAPRHGLFCAVCGGPGTPTNPLRKVGDRAGWVHARVPCPMFQLPLDLEVGSKGENDK